ncbi:MAG: DUF1269 domain-containing protein [Ktedonobacterales bacterium]
MSKKPVFLYVATYNSVNDAKADYEATKELYKSGVIATYDAAIINKDASGKVHISKHEKPTQHGAWTGAAIGAVAGLIFPPSIVVGAAVGAGVGALTGHLSKGMPRDDMKKIGTLLDTSTAALVVLGESRLQEKLKQAVTRAVQQYESQVEVDPKEFDKDFENMVNQLASSGSTSTSAGPNA